MPKDSASSHVLSRNYAAPYPPVQCVSDLSDGESAVVDLTEYGMTRLLSNATEVLQKYEDSGSTKSRSTPSSTPNTGDIHVPRPPNKFMLFRRETSNRDVPEVAEMNRVADRSNITAQLWDGLTENDKEYWQKKAVASKEERARQYLGYNYRPVRKHAREHKPFRLQHERDVLQFGRDNANTTLPDISLPEAAATTSLHASHALQPTHSSKFPQSGQNELPENWFHTSKGKRTAIRRKQDMPSHFAGNGRHVMHHPSNQGAVSRSGIHIPSLPSYIHAQSDYDGTTDTIPTSPMHRNLGPDSLLLQGFQYNRPFGNTNDLGITLDRSTKHRGRTSYGANPNSLMLNNEQFIMPPKAWWDFVTPDEPSQIEASNSSGNQLTLPDFPC